LPGFEVERGKSDFRESWGGKVDFFPFEIKVAAILNLIAAHHTVDFNMHTSVCKVCPQRMDIVGYPP
jgi:hypothetical protein